MIVTPTVAPIERANCVNAVAEPICARRTAFCTERTKTCMTEPMPMPQTTMLRAASPFVVWTSIRQSMIIPTARISGPTMTFPR